MPVSKLRMNAKSLFGAAFACALGFTAVIAWVPSALAGDDDDEAPDIKVIHSILEGIGLRPTEKNIDYHERSPLVIPPSSTLPPPETDAAASNPNWPVDPEVKRAKAERAAERNKVAGSSSEAFITASKPLPPDQLNVGQRKNSSRDAGAMSADESSKPFKPSDLGYKGGLFGNMFGKDDEGAAKFTGEPPRASLTDPPAGYRTPSPDQPYGNTKEKFTPKADNYYENHGTANVMK
jgi:hypothetical protein